MGREKEGTGRKKEGLDNQSEPRGGEMRGCALRVATSLAMDYQLTSSPSLSLSWPRPIRSKPELSQTALISGLQAHTGS